MLDYLKSFIYEDIGHGDITSEAICRGEKAQGIIIAKEDGIFAGLPFAIEVFKLLGEIKVLRAWSEGSPFKKGDILLELEGPADVLLKGERVSLNILQKLSGIASVTREYVKALEGSSIQILDTRKTTPGFRYFEKYAVRIGGGKNHRFALYDMVMIKDNHKRIAQGIKQAVERVKQVIGPAYKIEVEVENLEEVEEALSCGVDIIMLDNFSPKDVEKAVKIIDARAKVEVSGNITLKNIKDYIIEGVDFISVGAITHSAKWIDLSMKIRRI